jgi:hypothetical protein
MPSSPAESSQQGVEASRLGSDAILPALKFKHGLGGAASQLSPLISRVGAPNRAQGLLRSDPDRREVDGSVCLLDRVLRFSRPRLRSAVNQ